VREEKKNKRGGGGGGRVSRESESFDKGK